MRLLHQLNCGVLLDACARPPRDQTNVRSATTLGIRPEKVQIVASNASHALAGTVELVERVGADSFVVTQLGGGVAVNARVDAATSIKEGDRVAVTLPAGELRLFNAEGIAVQEGA